MSNLWKDANPAGSDVAGFLTAQGFNVPDGLDVFAGAALRQLHLRTGFDPFLGDTEAKIWRLGPHDSAGVLDLQGGFWEITSITAGVVNGSAGTLLVEGEDYQLSPFNAANEGRGWDEVQFFKTWGSAKGSIVIVAKRGYAQKMPVDVWQAVIEEAACGALLKTMPGHALAARIKQGPVDIDLGSGGIQKISSWHDNFELAIATYQRLVV